MRSILFAIFVFCPVSFAWQMNTFDLTGVDEIRELTNENQIVFASVNYPEEYARSTGILAINTETKEELWFFDTESQNSFYPDTPYYIQYNDNRIYAAVSNLRILCLDARSGAIEFLWECDGFIHDNFILDDGYLYALTYSEIMKLDARTGELEWELPIPGEDSDRPLNLCSFYLDKGKLIVGSIQTSMFCVDPSTGEIIWRNEDIPEWSGTGYSGARYVSDSLVFATANSAGLIALDATDGSIFAFYNGTYLAGDDDGVYLTLYENNENYFCVLDPLTGTISLKVIMDQGMDPYRFEIIDDLLCLVSSNGQLWVFPRNDVANISDYSYRKRISTKPFSVTVYGDRIFAISSDGVIFSVNSQLEDELEIETGLLLESPQLFSAGRCIIPVYNSLLILEY